MLQDRVTRAGTVRWAEEGSLMPPEPPVGPRGQSRLSCSGSVETGASVPPGPA